MRSRSATIWFVFCFALAGCASVERSRESLAGAKVCCASTATMPFKIAAAGVRQDLELGEGLPVFQFPEGKSFFAAFTLPEVGIAKKLDFMVGKTQPLLLASSADTVLVPQFMFLDDQHQVVHVEKEFSLFQGLTTIEPAFSTTSWATTVDIPPRAKHFVIYAQLERVGKTISIEYAPQGSSMFFAGRLPVYTPGSAGGRGTVPVAPTGRMAFRVR